LLLDHHYSTRIAERLRAAGHDVFAAVERAWHGPDDDALDDDALDDDALDDDALDDDALLERCAAENRVLLTNNVADFARITARWAGDGRRHAGLVFTSDATFPRTRDTIGRYVEALGRLLRAHPGDQDLRDRIRWLTAPQ
jgi:hypothetical protein